MNPHLVVYISHHGYGHGAQTTSVLNALVEQMPQLKVTVVSGLPVDFLRSRLRMPFALRPNAFDFGLAMDSVFDVKAEESLSRYRALHANWRQRIDEEAAVLRALRPDAVLSNVAYLPLAAAKRAGISCAGMSSLNWADIFAHYFPDKTNASILDQMQESYAGASVFVQLTPSMPMTWLANRRAVDPVASLGRDRGDEIRRLLGLSTTTKLVLATFGGIETAFNLDHWPRRADVFWLLPAVWAPHRDDMVAFESVGIPFIDLMRSSSAVLSKLGYGIVSECACNGVPLMFCERGDWPEEPYLQEWLRKNGRACLVPRAELASPRLLSALDQLLGQHPPVSPPHPDGAPQAASLVRGLLESY